MRVDGLPWVLTSSITCAQVRVERAGSWAARKGFCEGQIHLRHPAGVVPGVEQPPGFQRIGGVEARLFVGLAVVKVETTTTTEETISILHVPVSTVPERIPPVLASSERAGLGWRE